MSSDILDGLYRVVLDLNFEDAEDLAKKSIEEGIDPLQSAEALTKAIREIGEGFAKGDLFLPDLVLASKVLQRALPVIRAEIKRQGKKTHTRGKVVIGTVFGDIHSIGKQMVATLLLSSSYEVIDLGVNVKSSVFVEAVKKYNSDILAMSALLTTTAYEQKNIIKDLISKGMRDKVKIIVGGAPINQEFADSIGADGYAPTAPLAVTLVNKLLGLDSGG
ncbi:cobalamin-binding protein [Candidatus Aerophobetes bacterium Ae_b3b]|nr:MAG: cobalamin-binding protein [Candidatus Aerophobetes bacterium Ae_b3b]